MGRRKDKSGKTFRVETKRTEYCTYDVEADDEDEARENFMSVDCDYGDSEEEILSVEEL
jgi:hypothetical protein